MDGSLQALRETGSASTCVGRDRAVGHRADRRQNIAVTFIEPFRLRDLPHRSVAPDPSPSVRRKTF